MHRRGEVLIRPSFRERLFEVGKLLGGVTAQGLTFDPSLDSGHQGRSELVGHKRMPLVAGHGRPRIGHKPFAVIFQNRSANGYTHRMVVNPMYDPLARYQLQPARYTAYRAAGPIVVDGKLDEFSWQLAPKSAPFVDIVTGEPAWFDTRVALLWDNQHLYFGFWVEENDVWGTLTERDSKIYEENDVEVFIGGQDAYYEFEINALNTVYEVFWIWKDILKPGSPYYDRLEFDPARQRTMVLDGVGGHVHPRGERWGFLDWDFPGLRTAVHVDGVVNRRDKTDRGWTVELALPWQGFAPIADGRSLPPQDGDVWRIDCSRFEKIGHGGEVLDPCVGWTWNRHGHYDSHIPEVFPYVTFSKNQVG